MKIHNNLYILLLLCFLCGCRVETIVEKHIHPENDTETTCSKEAVTIRESYYLKTVLHDEHLFILSKNGYHFIHHPNCPCLNVKVEEKTEPKVELPTGNILDLLKGNK